MTLAIFDDIGAIVVIALFYSEGLSTSSLAMAAIGIAALVGLNLLSVTRTAAYVVVGVLLWVALLKSGVHATLAGVVIGFAIPLKVKGKKGSSPLHEMEYGLRSWLSLGVVPLFAFLNSGISLSGVTGNILLSPVALGVGLGLFIGKQIGVFGAT